MAAKTEKALEQKPQNAPAIPKDGAPDAPAADIKAAPKAETAETPVMPVATQEGDAEKPARPATKEDDIQAPVAVATGALDPAAARLVEVKVKPDYRWSSIQSAGAVWTKDGTRINSNDPRLAELQANPFVDVTPVAEE